MSQQISFLTPLFKMPDRNSVSSLASFYGELILKWLYSALLDAPCLVIVVQTLKSCPALCDSVDCSTAGFPAFAISQSLLKFMSIESVIPSNHRILCCPLHFLPSIFPSIRIFYNELALCIRWPKHWHFSFSISPSSEYSALISLGLTGLISL